MNELDLTPRYAPSHVYQFDGAKAYRCPVLQYVVHPAGTHQDSPIKNDMVALEMKTQIRSSWYGIQSGYINSELRMVVIGTPSRDEVRMKWEIVKPENLR